MGERDLVSDPLGEARAFRSTPELRPVHLPAHGHMHNFAGTRALFWERIHRFGEWCAAAKGYDRLRRGRWRPSRANFVSCHDGLCRRVIEGMDVTRPLPRGKSPSSVAPCSKHGVSSSIASTLSDAQMARFAAHFAPTMPKPFAPDTGMARPPVSEGNREPTKRSRSGTRIPPSCRTLRALPFCAPQDSALWRDTCFASMHARFRCAFAADAGHA
jgi:hypothetical protein